MTVEKIQRHSFSPEELLCCVSYEFCNFGYCFYSTGFPFFQNRGSLNNNLREVFLFQMISQNAKERIQKSQGSNIFV